MKGLGVIILGFQIHQIMDINFPSENTDTTKITGLEILTEIGRDTPMKIPNDSVRTVPMHMHFF